jgi:AcrR family transcriptional regulator
MVYEILEPKGVEFMPRHSRRMKISEISEQTGTSPATIRYYVREGLLPQPLKTGKTMAYYGDIHIQRLDSIKRLKNEGHDLKSIRQNLMSSTQIMPLAKNEVFHTRTRETIITAAVELFREKGYESTSIIDITARARVGKGTIYQYFKGKEDLFFECAESIFYDIAKDDPTVRDETDGLKRLWNRSIALTRTTRHIFDMLNLARGASIREDPAYKGKLEQIMQNFVEPIKADVEIAIAQGSIRPMDSTLIAHLLIGATEYAVYYEIDKNLDPEKVVLKGWTIVFGGIGVRGKNKSSKDKR